MSIRYAQTGFLLYKGTEVTRTIGAALDTWQIGTVPSRLFRIVGVVIHTNFFDNDKNWRTVYVGELSSFASRDAIPPEALFLFR